MMRRGKIFHNPALGSTEFRMRLGFPATLGENVGYGPKPGSIHAAFMRSDAHRRNALAGHYDHIGIGVVFDGRSYWVAEVFLGGIGAGPRTGAVRVGGGLKRTRGASGAHARMLSLPDGPMPPFMTGIVGREPVGEQVPWGAMTVMVVGLATPGLTRFSRHRLRRHS
jgi:hypothetical protein